MDIKTIDQIYQAIQAKRNETRSEIEKGFNNLDNTALTELIGKLVGFDECLSMLRKMEWEQRIKT